MPIWVMGKLASSTGRSRSFIAAEAIFVYGFAKSDQDNIRLDELKAFRKLAGEMLMLDDNALAAAVKNATIMEIEYHG
jgi:hypothetical protein